MIEIGLGHYLTLGAVIFSIGVFCYILLDMKTVTLPFIKALKTNLAASNLIQVVQGPRQVGKTTGIIHFLNSQKKLYHYISADGVLENEFSWVLNEWQKACDKKVTYFVIDEIQKIRNWSEIIKKIWDEKTRSSKHKQIKFILLGSSSLKIQKGLTESLTGRYQTINVYHWNFLETKKLISISLEQFLKTGGYPGSYKFIKKRVIFENFIKNSIIEPVINMDILPFSHIQKPALFKQIFNILCNYPAQEISYTKLLGQLQNKGNTELIKTYISFYEKAFLFKSLEKFSTKAVKIKSSSPKFIPLSPCFSLLSHQENIIPRMFEATVGAQLLRLPGELYYWRDRNRKVDFVFCFKNKVYGIEVKFGKKKSVSGMETFLKIFKKAHPVFIDKSNYENFLSQTQNFLLNR